MVRVSTPCNVEHWYELIGRFLYLATGKDALSVAVKQQSQHHFGRIGRTATTFVRAFYFTGIQLQGQFLPQSELGYLYPAILSDCWVVRSPQSCQF